MTAVLAMPAPACTIGAESAHLHMEQRWDGARLTEVREAACLSRKELADVLGSSPANITRWETTYEPKASHLYAVAEALGVTMTTLLEPVGAPIVFIREPDRDRQPRRPGRPRKSDQPADE